MSSLPADADANRQGQAPPRPPPPAGAGEDPAPSLIVVVPYRHRAPQLSLFERLVLPVLRAQFQCAPDARAPDPNAPDARAPDPDAPAFQVWYMHQHNDLPFNRGAMKNSALLLARQRWPAAWPAITLCFHDVDCAPVFPDTVDYRTPAQPGVLRQAFGLRHTLGGIVFARADDFARANGFPCHWTWGQEDAALQHRALRAGLTIDRSAFLPVGTLQVAHWFEGATRVCRARETFHPHSDPGTDGLSSLRLLDVDPAWADPRPAPDRALDGQPLGPHSREVRIRAFHTDLPPDPADRLTRLNLLTDPPRKVHHPLSQRFQLR